MFIKREVVYKLDVNKHELESLLYCVCVTLSTEPESLLVTDYKTLKDKLQEALKKRSR